MAKKKSELKKPFNLLVEPSVRRQVVETLESYELVWSEAAFFRVGAEYLMQVMDKNWKEMGTDDFNEWIVTLPPPF